MKTCFQASYCGWLHDCKIKQWEVSTMTSVLNVTGYPVKSSKITVQLFAKAVGENTHFKSALSKQSTEIFGDVCLFCSLRLLFSPHNQQSTLWKQWAAKSNIPTCARHFVHNALEETFKTNREPATGGLQNVKRNVLD